jgi:hypothetical protein
MRAISSVIAILSIAISGCATAQGSASRPTYDVATTQSTCAHVPAELQEGLLFGEHLEIVSARAVHRREGKQNVRRDVGAELFVASRPGVSSSMLTQAAQCHVARYATEARADDRDPLAVRGATVSVKEREAGFVVRISSTDREAARTIGARSVEL